MLFCKLSSNFSWSRNVGKGEHKENLEGKIQMNASLGVGQMRLARVWTLKGFFFLNFTTAFEHQNKLTLTGKVKHKALVNGSEVFSFQSKSLQIRDSGFYVISHVQLEQSLCFVTPLRRGGSFRSQVLRVSSSASWRPSLFTQQRVEPKNQTSFRFLLSLATQMTPGIT